MHEIVNILENIDINEETKIIKGSDIDKDLNNPEKYEIDENEGLIKKRKKKKIIDEDKNNKKPQIDLKINNYEDINKDENNFKSNYDLVLLKNLTLKIENIIKNKPQSEGMGELSNNLMSEIITENKKKKNKIIKTFSKINTITKNDSSENKKEVSFPSSLLSMRRSVINKSKTKSNIPFSINNREDTFPKSLKSISIKIDDFKNKFNENNNLNFTNFVNKNFIKKTKSIDDRINKYTYRNFNINKQGKAKRFSNLQITNNSKEYSINSIRPNKKFNNSYSDLSSIIFRNKNNSMNRLKKCINRNSLFAEKFIKKPTFYEKDFEKEKSEEMLPNINKLKLSNENKGINNLNAKLNYKVRKKTDNLIKTQYYISSYKNLGQINPNNSDFSNNKSNYFNSKNIMSNAKVYNKAINNNKIIRNRTLKDFRNSKKLYKSQSVFNIRNNINNS